MKFSKTISLGLCLLLGSVSQTSADEYSCSDEVAFAFAMDNNPAGECPTQVRRSVKEVTIGNPWNAERKLLGSTVSVTPGSSTTVGNCIPLGTNTGFGFTGMIYRDIPPFTMAVGDKIRFDIGSNTNNVDVRRNIFFGAANINPTAGGAIQGVGVNPDGWIQVTQDSDIPLNPRGDNVMGNYELTYTATAAFTFAGGGFLIGFQASPPAVFADTFCNQINVLTDSNDVSGNFHRRFYSQQDLPMGTLAGDSVALVGFIIEIAGDPSMGQDPHIKTWTGALFDFMGQCDLVLLQAPTFEAGKELSIHVRTTIQYAFSFIESAVLRIGDETFEVESFGQYSLAGVDQADLEGHTLSGFPIYHTIKSDKHQVFDVVLGPTENITISTFKNLVSLSIHGATDAHFGESVGIMGSASGAMLSRDGSVMSVATSEGANAFGQEWQVREEEPMLFRTVRSPQASNNEKCELPDIDAKESRRRRLGEGDIVRVDAEQACAKYSGASLEACIYDVLAVGDLEIAEAGVY